MSYIDLTDVYRLSPDDRPLVLFYFSKTCNAKLMNHWPALLESLSTTRTT